jgi:hypothetical protein
MTDSPDINPIFASHVTSIAFNLSLSKNMVVAMTDVATNANWARDTYRALGMPSNFISGLRGLLERGLVFAPDPQFPGRCEFTEAGKAVFALLQMAGLVQRIEAKIAERKSA